MGAVVAARVGRSRGAVVRFIDKVVFVLLQLKFQQSSVYGQFIDRVLDIPVVLREGYPQCKLCRRLFLRRRPGDQQRQVPTVQRFESSCPRGEHSCCATYFRRDSTGAVLGVLGSC